MEHAWLFVAQAAWISLFWCVVGSTETDERAAVGRHHR